MSQEKAGYVFSQNPSAVPNTRKKYRDPPIDYAKQNIMWDKRIVRGNTYAAQIPTPNEIVLATAAEERRRKVWARRNVNTEEVFESDEVVPVEGRHNMEVQTEDFLEDLDEAVIELDATTQTNFVIDMPDPVIKYRKPYGQDKYTFIEKGELFEFQKAVQPILATLMGKALDYGVSEVLEEEELKWLENYQAKFEQNRQDVLEADRKMERQAMAANEEKERMMGEERARYFKEKDVAHKVACTAYAKNYLAEFQNHVLANLEDSGAFRDPAERDVKQIFLPWVQEKMGWHLTEENEMRNDVDRLLRLACGTVQAEQAAREKANAEAAAAAAAAEAKRLEELRLEEERAAESSSSSSSGEGSSSEDEGDSEDDDYE